MDLWPRWTSPMNFPERLARSPSRSWRSSRCWRSARRRCPRNFLTCLTARSVMGAFLRPYIRRFVGAMQPLDGLGATRHDREDEGALAARHAVDAAGRAPRVGALHARAAVVRHAALEDEDLLVTQVALAGGRGAGCPAQQHGLAVAVLPEDFPVDARPALLPGSGVGVHVHASPRVCHRLPLPAARPPPRPPRPARGPCPPGGRRPRGTRPPSRRSCTP